MPSKKPVTKKPSTKKNSWQKADAHIGKRTMTKSDLPDSLTQLKKSPLQYFGEQLRASIRNSKKKK